MKNKIKALPTTYSGVTFRSRLEARWAVYFDVIGLEWEYELQGYALPAGWYLPDFWLPQVRLHAEVKPFDLTPLEMLKVEQLVEGTEHGCLLLCGSPRFSPVPVVEFGTYCCEEETDKNTRICDTVISMHKNYPINEHRFFSSTGTNTLEEFVSVYGDGTYPNYFHDVRRAADIARSAKFGH